MTKKLKDYYDSNYANQIADKILAVYPKFNKKKFINETSGFKSLEFLQRQDLFAEGLEKTLPEYSEAIDILTKILGDKLNTTTGMFTTGWWLWPVGRYVERNGLKNFKASLDFIYELTQRHTGEFAIRNILGKYPAQTLKILKKWSLDPSVHVRRLSSEAVRLRLPWAKKINVFIDYFDDCFEIINNLKEDKEKFIQKSVANNINDLFKVDSKLAEKIIREWEKSTNLQTLWIVKHATRSLLKKKNGK